MSEMLLNFPERMNSLELTSYKGAIVVKHRLVGYRTFQPLTRRVGKTGCEIFEADRGKGYATASMRLLIRWAFDSGFETLLTGVRTDNVASIKVLWNTGWRVDYITTEPDGDYYQCRLESAWQSSARESYWLPDA